MTGLFALKANPRAELALGAFTRGRFPHALLIEGPEGSGKSSFARRVAMAALCRNQSGAPCGECPCCKKVAADIHPDLLVFEGEKGKAKSFHVDKVRELRAKAYVRPNEGERKVLLLEDAHNMTEQAQNALLKVLEEPPDSTVFILTSLSRGQLRETVLSRLTVISLRYPDIEGCADILAGLLPELPRDELLQAAEDASGSVGLALAALNREGDGKAAGYRRCAADVLELLERGREAEALARLCVFERDRPGMLAVLEAFSDTVTHRLLHAGERGGLTGERLVRIAAITEDIISAAHSNVGGLLLGSALCARIIESANG